MPRRFDEPGNELLDFVACTPSSPNVGRMFDYCLGGRDHYECDRDAVDELLSVAPTISSAFKANRDFLERAVGYCTGAGVDQFIDIGAGVTAPSIANMVRSVRRGAVVVGVDNDPSAVQHHRALAVAATRFVNGDIRQIETVLEDPALARSIDWQRPVGLVMGAVMHHICDDDDPYGIMQTIQGAVAPGSVLVLSHLCSTGSTKTVTDRVEGVYAGASADLTVRTHEQISHFFDGFALVPPGVVQVQHWPASGEPAMAPSMLGGIARKPEATAR